eukprot:scaffold338_cov155-Skeletonema_menzelii.AAC.13
MDEGSYSSSPLRATTLSSSTQDRPPKRHSLLLRYDSPCAICMGLIGIVTLGSILAFIFPSEEGTHTSSSSWDVISNVLGYSYFLAWTLSFYPQIITNCKHPEKAVRGLSLDFIIWNIIGFSLYAVYTTSLRYSAVVRQEYADRFGGGGGVVFESDVPVMEYYDASLANTTIFNIVMDTVFIANSSNSSNTTGDKAVAVPQVKTNDVAFAWHALILSIITFLQVICNENKTVNRNVEFAELDRWINSDEQEGMRLDDSLGNDSFILNEDDFGQQQQQEHQKQKRNQDHSNASQSTTHFTESDFQRTQPTHLRWTKRISSTTKILIAVLILTCSSLGSFIATNVGSLNLLDFLYFLSYIKVGITAVKYIPQVMLNYRRKSTAGWAIWNILLDFTGGSLSIIQLIGDSFAQDGSWTGVVGNPAKLGLGLISICFDVVFIVQHYILYRKQPVNMHIQPTRNVDDSGIGTMRSDHDTPLLAGIQSLL